MTFTVAITGINRGIGEGLARRFLSAGNNVIGLGRRAPAWLENNSNLLQFINCDFSDPSMMDGAAEQVTGPVDVLICNAASFGSGAFHLSQTTHGAFADVFAVNVISPVLLAAALKPKLEKGSRKLIVMMSTGNASLSGNTQGTMLGYRCSKSALNQAVRTIAAEWGPSGITAIALNPGWVRTDMGGPNAPLSVDEAADNVYHFVTEVAEPALNGLFLNTDGSQLPW
jgi:NAD(P)-dependent dehydrogenase (short-subunit alcohol dehydrogenase family)